MQEIDLKTGLVIYEWHSLDHVPLPSSYASAAPASRPNRSTTSTSTRSTSSRTAICSSTRATRGRPTTSIPGPARCAGGWAASTAASRWGRARAPPGSTTRAQQPDGTITFFDNGALPQVHPQSRAIEVALDTASMTATLVRSYEHRNPLVAGSQGNCRPCRRQLGGRLGPGALPLGIRPQRASVLFDAHLPPSWESYRAYVLPWTGGPAQPPALAVPPPGASGGATVYASWNGATEVASWRVLAGSSPTRLTPVASAAKTGFETAIALPAAAAGAYVAVQALDGSGAVLGISPAVKAVRLRLSGRAASRLQPPSGRRPSCSGAAFAPRGGAGRGVLGGGEVVGEAAGVRGGRRARQRTRAARPLKACSSSRAQRFLQRAVPGAVVQLQAAAWRAVVVQLGFLPRATAARCLPSGQLRVGRVLGLRRAHRDDVQRRVGRVRFDRELGHRLVGGVQHVGAPRRRGVGEDRRARSSRSAMCE